MSAAISSDMSVPTDDGKSTYHCAEKIIGGRHIERMSPQDVLKRFHNTYENACGGRIGQFNAGSIVKADLPGRLISSDVKNILRN